MATREPGGAQPGLHGHGGLGPSHTGEASSATLATKWSSRPPAPPRTSRRRAARAVAGDAAGQVDGQLEVGEVLVGRVRVQLGTLQLELTPVGRLERVEVADDVGDA